MIDAKNSMIDAERLTYIASFAQRTLDYLHGLTRSFIRSK